MIAPYTQALIPKALILMTQVGFGVAAEVGTSDGLGLAETVGLGEVTAGAGVSLGK